MLRDPGAELVAAAQDLKHARGKDGHADLAELEVAVGRVGRRLHDQHVAGHERGAHLAGAEQDRPVPGHDAGADAERRPRLVDGALGPVLEDLVIVEAHGRERPQPLERHRHLRLRELDRLALLRGLQGLELGPARLHGVREGEQEPGALREGRLRPRLECGAGVRDGRVEVFPSSDRHLVEWLAGRWVDGVARGGRRHEFVVDDVAGIRLFSSLSLLLCSLKSLAMVSYLYVYFGSHLVGCPYRSTCWQIKAVDTMSEGARLETDHYISSFIQQILVEAEYDEQ